MRQTTLLFSAVAVLASSWTVGAYKGGRNYTTPNMQSTPFSIYGDRPDGCPPCFNCNLEAFQCRQFADCSPATGRCICPEGWGGEDCTEPLCGSLPGGRDRVPRNGPECECEDGWGGINCNVCRTDTACNAMTASGEGGVCYKDGLVVRKNFQQCDITNKKILETLKKQKPQATFACDAETEECNFQFWVDQRESFYCALDHCGFKFTTESDRNITEYNCQNIKCACIPDRMLCGESGSVDIGEFLQESIKGPASFRTTSTDGGSASDGSVFSEPAMNQLISDVFGDETITLSCDAGECLHETEVPGYERPVKRINTPLIAGVIAGCALFVVAVILGVWYLSRSSGRWGPIHLSDDEDDEQGKLMADHKPAALFFQNVSYRLKGKQILADIQGAVRPGELMAIMGASGAGKTTFLDILARKNKRGEVMGDFFINGEKVLDDEFRSVIGFVDQEDTLLPTLTVHETIMDSAMLRLPKDMSLSAKTQRVEDVEKQLGIYHIRHQIIGSEEGNGRGISGGEKRRVGIACELVTSPSILFLDEPTSGLDAFNAFNVVECLVNLVKNYNRTVIFTIHQPRSNIVALFDQLILLARGRTVYSGPFNQCQAYFDQIGFACPPGFNIADYLVDLTMHAGTSHMPIDESSSLFDRRAAPPTRASSTIAIKSVPSIAGSSMNTRDVAGSPSESLLRPQSKRRTSIKQQQDRQLFTRKKSADPSTVAASKTDDEALIPESSIDSTQQWLRLSRQHGAPPPQILDDLDELPPPANGATGTDLDMLVAHYASSDVATTIREETQSSIQSANTANGRADDAHSVSAGRVKGYDKVGFFGQFVILSTRTWRNIYRNPVLMLTHYVIAIVLAAFLGFLFYGLTDDIAGFQNRLGLFFFLLALFGFSTLTTLYVFSSERLLFVRERAKGYYSPLSYFTAKVIFDIVPLRLIPPLIMGTIVYPMTGLLPQWPEFFKFIMFLVLFNLAAAAICLFIGIIFKNGGVANLIGSLVMLFSLLFSGFLLNHNTIPPIVTWMQNLSIFHYGFEGLIVNEVRTLSLVDKKYGLDIEVPGAAILSSFGFNVLALKMDALGLAVFAASFVVLSYGAMHFLLVEQR
ncbi:hypothetical protein EJ06DRAFT_580110 [Trichodelitschia bisporula]|uniref:ABC transporter domain-containing protein n=1 Tax=Trichodelitschia bisporula TaxID=703511 RepID=A0A6G1I497_9PEZI|nr:hypothetical protein EJ06DRAFT_580110 [Trichodelitschia bisporula]